MAAPVDPGAIKEPPRITTFVPDAAHTEGSMLNPRPGLAKDLGLEVDMEGWVTKATTENGKPTSFTFFWQKRYLVLYSAECELRYYAGVRESRFGNVPLDERACIPIESISHITTPPRDDPLSFDSKAFNIHFKRWGKGRGAKMPRAQYKDQEGQRDTEHSGVLSVIATDPTNKFEWIARISSYLPGGSGQAF